MRILLVHPDDHPERGPWVKQTWDRVIDLGRGGELTYERWTRQFGCPVAPLDSLRIGVEEFRRVREVLAAGKGRLLDEEKLDWWELTAIFFHQQIELMGILCRLTDSLGGSDQVFVTRPGFHADALREMLSNRLQSFSTEPSSQRQGVRHYLRTAWKFPLPQLLEILGDKYDASYSIRGVLRQRRKASSKPVVLLPSGYVNVSRLGVAYAKTALGTDFLLVATRRSGWVPDPPPNVGVAWLASYAYGSRRRRQEYEELLEKWRALRPDLQSVPEIAMLGHLGILDSFPKFFRQGLAIRDAWRGVFETETVRAVLCGDDSNPYTHIPLLLARNRDLPTLTSHHGAFDGRHLIKPNYSDVILVKGKMEEDYLLRVCGLPPVQVEIGAPAKKSSDPSTESAKESGAASSIVFFSESYEVSSGRTEEFYRDVLPSLADLAILHHRKLIIKLHPFEMQREREKLVRKILSPQQRRVTTVVSGPLTKGLLHKTWFGITVLSTVVMECALHGIPCFLCGWLEFSPYGYIEQYTKFGVGYLLRSVAELSEIPKILQSYAVKPEIAKDLWEPISPNRFQELLSGSGKRDGTLSVR